MPVKLVPISHEEFVSGKYAYTSQTSNEKCKHSIKYILQQL